MAEQKPINDQEESPLPIAENPIYAPLPPKKPPRTFEDNHQKVPSSSSSNSNSPTFDLGMYEVLQNSNVISINK
jgi:hypothetical protein